MLEARLADERFYAREVLHGVEGATAFAARWVPLATFAPGGPPLYPRGCMICWSAADYLSPMTLVPVIWTDGLVYDHAS